MIATKVTGWVSIGQTGDNMLVIEYELDGADSNCTANASYAGASYPNAGRSEMGGGKMVGRGWFWLSGPGTYTNSCSRNFRIFGVLGGPGGPKSASRSLPLASRPARNGSF